MADGNGPVEGWVTQQPYSVGVLLTSSNASTWTANQNADLTFQLLGCLFTANSKTVQYGTLSIADVTDLNFFANVFRPTSDCNVIFEADEAATGLTHLGQEGAGFPLTSRITDTLTLKANLTGTSKMSPIIYSGSQVLTGNLDNADIYASNAFQASDAFDMTLIFQVLRPGASAIVPYCAIDDGLDAGTFVWAALSPQGRVPVGDGWFEETWTITNQVGYADALLTRIKLALSGGPQSRPFCRSLRAFTTAHL